ncbi:MAG: hypothetical protein HC825_02225 [Oscillatoriales cyanobacterium RM1_1_9]|nr:hypothetical protein [Oscillatoriales cyanobacterium RM1_1_9]
MTLQSLWITGGTQSGKTTHLIEQMQQWGPDQFWQKTAFKASTKPANKTPKTIKNRQVNRSGCNRMALIFAANSHNRLRLVDQINQATQGQYPFRSTTPLAFFEDEVLLFWPLLVEALHLKTRLPLRLRPEMEQEMATRFWHPALESGQLSRLGVNPDRIVRQVLDIFQLAALGGVPLNQVNLVLEQVFPS